MQRVSDRICSRDGRKQSMLRLLSWKRSANGGYRVGYVFKHSNILNRLRSLLGGNGSVHGGPSPMRQLPKRDLFKRDGFQSVHSLCGRQVSRLDRPDIRCCMRQLRLGQVLVQRGREHLFGVQRRGFSGAHRPVQVRRVHCGVSAGAGGSDDVCLVPCRVVSIHRRKLNVRFVPERAVLRGQRELPVQPVPSGEVCWYRHYVCDDLLQLLAGDIQYGSRAGGLLGVLHGQGAHRYWWNRVHGLRGGHGCFAGVAGHGVRRLLAGVVSRSGLADSVSPVCGWPLPRSLGAIHLCILHLGLVYERDKRQCLLCLRRGKVPNRERLFRVRGLRGGAFSGRDECQRVRCL